MLVLRRQDPPAALHSWVSARWQWRSSASQMTEAAENQLDGLLAITASCPAPAKAAAGLLLSPPEPFRAGQPQSYRHGRFPWVGFPSRKATSLGKEAQAGERHFDQHQFWAHALSAKSPYECCMYSSTVTIAHKSHSRPLWPEITRPHEATVRFSMPGAIGSG